MNLRVRSRFSRRNPRERRQTYMPPLQCNTADYHYDPCGQERPVPQVPGLFQDTGARTTRRRCQSNSTCAATGIDIVDYEEVAAPRSDRADDGSFKRSLVRAKNKPQKSNSGMLVIGLAGAAMMLLVLVGAGVGVFFWLRGDSESGTVAKQDADKGGLQGSQCKRQYARRPLVWQ